MSLLTIVLFAAGIALLVVGAELLVKGAAAGSGCSSSGRAGSSTAP